MKLDSWMKKLAVAGFIIGFVLTIYANQSALSGDHAGYTIGRALGISVGHAVVFGIFGTLIDWYKGRKK